MRKEKTNILKLSKMLILTQFIEAWEDEIKKELCLTSESFKNRLIGRTPINQLEENIIKRITSKYKSLSEKELKKHSYDTHQNRHRHSN